MGRREKIGRRRKDKFYHLAKETGYRARSAFKLIQLNRKFNFLEKARVCVDLCAAPGGWCQVAVKHMPVSSLIIGVDLVPIKPIHKNVICLQEDITTDKCRSAIRRELKTWKVDVVLNDGAPNVGAAWVQDAFTQSELTLSALKLACDFLVPNGTFVTKIFRSKDYQALIDTLNQLFRKVHATKPQASRLESAEIFVVCQGYKAPKKVDPKLVDPKFVFQEESMDPTIPSLFRDKKPAAEGYEEGLSTVYRERMVSQFITSKDHLDVLSGASKLVFDSKIFSAHPLTTDEIQAHCDDIKVLGKRELRALLKWRTAMRKVLEEVDKEEKKPEDLEDAMDAEDKQAEDADSANEDESAVTEALAAIKAQERLKKKKAHKTMMKQKKDLEKQLHLGMKHKGDVPVVPEDHNLFSLRSIRSASALENFTGRDCVEDQPENSSNFVPGEDSDSENEEEYSEADEDTSDDEWIDETEMAAAEALGDVNDSDDDKQLKELAMDSDSDNEAVSKYDSDEDKEDNPLVVTEAEEGGTKTARWFNRLKDMFGDEVLNEAEDMDVLEEPSEDEKEEETAVVAQESSESEAAEESDDDSDDDSDYDERSHRSKKPEPMPAVAAVAAAAAAEKKKKASPFGRVESKKKQLDAAGLALGSLMVSSRKARETIEDQAYNRYTFSDESLPAWFADEEKHYVKRQMPITKEMVTEYKTRLKEINARPCKKVAEAKQRKKRKAIRRLEKAKKMASAIDNKDASSAEKAKDLKRVYMKLNTNKKVKTTYVVAKKSGATKRARRPDGVKGKYKVVDPRMKKDMGRAAKAGGKGGKGGKGKGGKAAGRGGRGKGKR